MALGVRWVSSWFYVQFESQRHWSLAFYFLGSHSHQPKEQLRHAVSAPVFDCHAEFRSCRDLNGAIARWRLKSAKYEKANRTGDEKEGIYKVCWHLSEFGMRYSVKILSESQNKFSNIWFWTPWLPVIHLVPSGMRYTYFVRNTISARISHLPSNIYTTLVLIPHLLRSSDIRFS